MILSRSFFAALLLTSALAVSCGRAPEKRTEIVRLDHAIEAGAVTPDMTEAADAWILATTGRAVASDNARDSALAALASSEAWRVFGPDIESHLGPLDEASEALGRIDSLPARIYGIVSPYRQSVVVADTLIFIGLNHYLGADYPGYASFPRYAARLKTPARIPLDVAEAWLSSRFPFPDSIAAPTVQQQIVWQGAVLAAAADMLGMPDGAELMGWTPEEWADAKAHEDEAWRRIAGQQLLFSDDPEAISRLTAPAPSTPDISPDAPGRLGRFIGLRIVRAADVSPLDILASRSYLSPDIIAPYARRR